MNRKEKIARELAQQEGGLSEIPGGDNYIGRDNGGFVGMPGMTDFSGGAGKMLRKTQEMQKKVQGNLFRDDAGGKYTQRLTPGAIEEATGGGKYTGGKYTQRLTPGAIEEATDGGKYTQRLTPGTMEEVPFTPYRSNGLEPKQITNYGNASTIYKSNGIEPKQITNYGDAPKTPFNLGKFIAANGNEFAGAGLGAGAGAGIGALIAGKNHRGLGTGIGAGVGALAGAGAGHFIK